MALKTEPQKIAHLLRRFGFGASESEMDYYSQGGLKGAIDKLINFERVPDVWEFDLSIAANEKGNVPVQIAQALWYCRLLVTNRPLQEKMTLFWHDHFATSAQKVDISEAMDNHINVLRTHAMGKFSDLLHAISKDPAMLYWLDNHENLASRPNENFAREVMELFTLGIGHYTEKDIQEGARAFSGWTFGRKAPNGRVFRGQKPRGQQTFVVDDRNHDAGEKTFLGRKGTFDGDQVLDILCDEPQTPRFIVKKMWEWFAYQDPDVNLVERLARTYKQSGLDNTVLVRAIMESPEFYSEKAEKGCIKNPVDFCVATARAFGLNTFQLSLLKTAKDGAETPRGFRVALLGGLLLQATKGMGMALMLPPDVAGWDIGQGWISSATMVERIKWADKMFNPTNRQGGPIANNSVGPLNQGFYFFSILGQESDPDKVAEKLVSILDAESLRPKLNLLRRAAEDAAKGEVTAQNVRQVIGNVCRVIYGSPEFQFA